MKFYRKVNIVVLGLLPILSGAGLQSIIAGNTIAPIAIKSVQPFDLTNVRLSDGIFKQRQDHDLEYIKTLDPDKYLNHFRRNAGITTNSSGVAINNKNHYSGWESLGSSTFGHYISALVNMYKSTGDTDCLLKTNYIIDELYYIQNNATNPDSNFTKGALVAFYNNDNDQPQEPDFIATFNELRSGLVKLTNKSDSRTAIVTDPYYKYFYWLSGGLPWYTNHKIFAGIRDAYKCNGNEKAKSVFLKYCDWVCWVSANISVDNFQKMLWSEHGGMNEVLTDAYAISGDTKYLTYSLKFNEQVTMNVCVNGTQSQIASAISNTHANAQIPQFFGALRQYEYTGTVDYLNIAKNFFTYVAAQQTFATGGNSEWEQFRTPSNISSQITRRSGESCNTYNMLKIAKVLYEFTGSETYADYYERALYNHILASMHMNYLGAFTYFVSLESGFFKTFSTPYDAHWCCVGTGMENHGKYGEFIYFHNHNDLFVNMFIPSTLNWSEKGFKVRIITQFPESDVVYLVVNATDGAQRNINIRYPQWAEKGIAVKINGQNQTITTAKGQYISLNKTWSVNDTIELTIPLSLRKEVVPNTTNQFAFFYGPVLLAGKLGNSDMPASVQASDQNAYTSVTTYNYKGIVPYFKSDVSAEQALTPVVGSPLTFKATNTYPTSEITFVPLYNIQDERYAVYWKFSDEE